MKNVAFCGRRLYCYFAIAFLCLNLSFGILVYYSIDHKVEWRQTVLSTGLYIKDALNERLLKNNSMMHSLGKRWLSPSVTQPYGYVLPYAIYEQQTASARNLWGLQFWAKSVDMKVVEPFFAEHTLSFKSVVMGLSNPMRFGDLYDIDYWNNQSAKHNCSELVKWEDFLSNAPKKVILVLNRGFKPNSRNAANTGMVKMVNNPDAIVGTRSCGSNMEFPENSLTYFKHNGFYFVREVCITFNSSTPMTMEEYSHHILGHFSPNQVTVIFAFWQGIRSNRVNLKGVSLDNSNTVEIGLLPSREIVEESDRYLQKLNLNNNNNQGSNKYFGVMVRIEKVFTNFVVHKKLGSVDKFVDYMLKCAAGLKHLREFDVHKRWRRTLAIDMGKFGSVNFKKHGEEAQHSIQRLYDAYFSSVFNKEDWSIEEFEGSFKKYLDTENPVYIAQIQRTIAARSDCLILVGGQSTFQTVAISFYKNFHPDSKQHCIVKHCYYGHDFDYLGFLQEKNNTKK